MKVIFHQAIGMHLPAGLLARLAERFKKPLTVLIIGEDRLPPVASIHHMIDCTGILNAQLAGHEQKG
jgi:hypothetical protein